MTQDATALLPCPFCGGKAVDRREIDGFPMIYCNGDECFGPQTTARNFEDALIQWNTRATLGETSMTPAQDATALADAIARLRASTNGDDAAFEEGNPFDDLVLLLTDYDRLRATSHTPDTVREALKQIRLYCDENLGPSRSSLLNKIAKLADDALSTPSASAASAGPQAEAVARIVDPDSFGMLDCANDPAEECNETTRRWMRKHVADKIAAATAKADAILALYAHPQPQPVDGRGETIQNAAEQSATADRASGSLPTVPPSGAIRSNGEPVLSADGRGAVIEAIAARLKAQCGAADRCSCAEGNWQWHNDGCDRLLGEVCKPLFRAALQKSPATDKAPAVGAQERNTAAVTRPDRGGDQ